MTDQNIVLPHVTAVSPALLHAFEFKLLQDRNKIENWMQEQWTVYPPPLYGSVDLRNAGFKLAPVDMNLFPAGFNNLHPALFECAAKSSARAVRRFVPDAKRILIIPESHTRNLHYWENMYTLKMILERAEFEVRIGFLGEQLSDIQELALPSGRSVTLERLQRKNNQLFVHAFSPDFILLNNDLSGGVPEILQGKTQTLYPPAELGWHQRLKSSHFQYYDKVTEDFSALLEIDPWWITPLFRFCGDIDFMQQSGLHCLKEHVHGLFTTIQKKYDEYGIKKRPFVVVKADAGTYGMAVMTIRDSAEWEHLNREQRKRMAFTKGGQPVTRVIVQEGVYTFETIGEDQAVAEPVVYLWGDCVSGGFYRIHETKGVDENLNAPGAHFQPLSFTQSCQEPEQSKLLYAYGVVARLSMLAAAREIVDQTGKK